MSDLNLLYNNVGKNSSSALWNDQQVNGSANNSPFGRGFTAGTANNHAYGAKQDDDLRLGQSIYKSYLDALRVKSDESSQKLLKSLENSPADTVNKLFGRLQTASSANLNKLFEGVKIDSADELEQLLGGLSDKEDDKKTDDDEKTENAVQKYIKKTTEKLSAENTALNKNSEQLSDSVQKVYEAFEENEETGDIDTDKAYSAAEDFVKSYNSFADALKGAKSGAVSGKAQFIADMLNAYKGKLGKVGITRDENGELTVDRDKLAVSAPKEREEVFGKKDSFAEFIDGQAKQLSAYAKTDIYQRSSAYTDAGNITQISNISGSYFNMLG